MKTSGKMQGAFSRMFYFVRILLQVEKSLSGSFFSS
mgnify:CR=1 FL=1|jgi:hypothetical protein